MSALGVPLLSGLESDRDAIDAGGLLPGHLLIKRDFAALAYDVATIGDDVVAVRDALKNFTSSSGYFDALVRSSASRRLCSAD